MSDKTIVVPAAEYRWLQEIYLESLKVRDQGVMAFNRLPPPMRLAIVSLALHYRDHGAPKGTTS